jgi:hypothetical protein
MGNEGPEPGGTITDQSLCKPTAGKALDSVGAIFVGKKISKSIAIPSSFLWNENSM